MNKPDEVNLIGPFEVPVLEALRRLPGLTVTFQAQAPSDAPDAVLSFADRTMHFRVEVKRQASAATAWVLVRQAQQSPDLPLLLVSRRASPDAREILSTHGIALIDGSGYAHIERPDFFIHIEGAHREEPLSVSPPKLTGLAGVAAQALLQAPSRSWKVRDLAAEAEISTALAHRVLRRLEMERVVAVEGRGPQRVRRIIDPGALLDLWAEEQKYSPKRIRAYRLAQSWNALRRDVGRRLSEANIPYSITGSGAASLLAPFVTTVSVLEAWVTSTASSRQVLTALEAEEVDGGHNVLLLQGKDDSALRFRHETDGVWVTDPLRLYVELRRNPHRGREQADHLRTEVIRF